jgi:hypothetical protein
MDTKSIKSARDLLCNRRLIEISKGSLGVYTYILLNPSTREPFLPLAGRTGLRRYHSPVKEQSKQRSDPNSLRKTEVLRIPGPGGEDVNASQIAPRLEFRCFSCKGKEFWTRGMERICLRCHPDPRRSIPQCETCSPTATEMGF